MARQLLVFVDDVNIFGKSMHNVQKNTESLLVANNEFGLKYMVRKLHILSSLVNRIQDKITT
jgi:hypothetical protein